ncbi:MAG: hypothetical protein QOJ48_1228, partial [Frankiales bacterium]|nr:hypothetical protein [Frankiales bacterium]
MHHFARKTWLFALALSVASLGGC